MTMNYNFMNIAHRGASGYCPENTMAAFKYAIELGIKNLECDVRLTNDNHVVVIHDSTVNRTTDGSGQVINHNLNQIKQLDTGSWFDKEFAGERIPTLEEVLSFLDLNINLVVEIKDGENSPQLIDRVIKIITDRKLIDRVRISSFSLKVLRQVKKSNIKFITSALFEELDLAKDLNSIKSSGINIISPHFSIIDRDLVNKVHALGYPVIAWGLKQANEKVMKFLVMCGVDGMTTNYPDILERVYLKSKKIINLGVF